MKANAETDESEVLSIAGYHVEILPPSGHAGKLISSYAATVQVPYVDGGERHAHTGLSDSRDNALFDLWDELNVVRRVCTNIYGVDATVTIAEIDELMRGIFAAIGDE